MIRSCIAIVIASLLAGCDRSGSRTPAATPVASPLRVERIKLGDTSVVRNFGAGTPESKVDLVKEIVIGGSSSAPEQLLTNISYTVVAPDGAVIFYETGAKQLRLFDSTGRFVRNIGRHGTGPGEYEQLNGLTVTPKGDVIAWSRLKVIVFGSNGDFVRTFPAPGAERRLVSQGSHSDVDGNFFSLLSVPNPEFPDSVLPGGRKPMRDAAIRVTIDGSVVDTILRPRGEAARQIAVTAREETVTYKMSWGIPLGTGSVSSMSPMGYFIVGRASVYSIFASKPGQETLRIELDRAQIPVDEVERRDILVRDNFESALYRATPVLTLSDISESKPFFRDLRVAPDGRIWAQLYATGTRVAMTERDVRIASIGMPVPPGTRTPTHQWLEPTVFDVFEPTGEFIGEVTLPTGATFAAARGDKIWLLMRDALDVPSLIRFRLGWRRAGE